MNQLGELENGLFSLGRVLRVPRVSLLGLCVLSLLLAACGPTPVAVSRSGHGAFEVDLASDGERVAIVWHDDRHGVEEIYLRLFDAQLQPLSAESRLSHSPRPAWEADIAFTGPDIAVAWYERQSDGRFSTWLGLWDDKGEEYWLKQLAEAGVSARIPVLLAGKERLFVAWLAEGDAGQASILGTWYDLHGELLEGPFPIAPASRTTWNLNAALLPDETVVLVFDAAFETRASELYLAQVSQQGSLLIPLSADDGHDSKYPDIAVHNGRVALSWQDWRDGNEEVWFGVSAWPLASESFLNDAGRITDNPTASQGAYLAWNDAQLALFWNDEVDGRYEIHWQPFNWQAEALAPVHRLTRSRSDSRIPSPASLGADDFVVAWGEVGSSGGHAGESGRARGQIMAARVSSR